MTVDLEKTFLGLAQHVLVGLAMMGGFAGPGGSAGKLLSRALGLDPFVKGVFSPFPSVIAAVAELLVLDDPATALRLGSIASRLGKRAWYTPMYAQDQA